MPTSRCGTVLAAVAACTSSRPSRAAKLRTITHRPGQQRSGSTPHEGTERISKCRIPPCWLTTGTAGRVSSQQHSPETTSSPDRQRRAAITCRSARSSTRVSHMPPGRAIHTPIRGDQIPIAIAARSRSTSRGFLPWRLSDDGPGTRRIVVMGRHPKPFTEPDSEGRILGPIACGVAFVQQPSEKCTRRDILVV